MRIDDGYRVTHCKILYCTATHRNKSQHHATQVSSVRIDDLVHEPVVLLKVDTQVFFPLLLLLQQTPPIFSLPPLSLLLSLSFSLHTLSLSLSCTHLLGRSIISTPPPPPPPPPPLAHTHTHRHSQRHELQVLIGTTATHCNTLQHYATHCNTLQHKTPGLYVTTELQCRQTHTGTHT